jgi:hypothetical protein
MADVSLEERLQSLLPLVSLFVCAKTRVLWCGVVITGDEYFQRRQNALILSPLWWPTVTSMAEAFYIVPYSNFFPFSVTTSHSPQWLHPCPGCDEQLPGLPAISSYVTIARNMRVPQLDNSKTP